jgi:DNA-directed RNA polymerase subunit F
MSEVTDLVMPVLQKIQADLAEVKRVQAEHSERFERIDERFEQIDHRFEDMEIYLAYATGIETQNKQDLRKVKDEIRNVKKRLETLETRP